MTNDKNSYNLTVYETISDFDIVNTIASRSMSESILVFFRFAGAVEHI